MVKKEDYARLIKEKAIDLGFSFARIAKAERMDEEARRLEDWLNQGYQGEMSYLERNFDKRIDPTLLVPGAKSVISLLYNYYPSSHQRPEAPKLAKYAYGKDYHFIVKDKLRTLFAWIEDNIGAIDGRIFVDSAPVLERDWARRSGLGWIGKNTMLIHPKAGSFFFLAELIIDLDLKPDLPIKDYCGTCRRCIDACPTQAIDEEGYQMDGSRCISYATIELRENIPPSFKGKMDNWMFGCDICQDVCPWNRFSTPHHEEAFEPHPDLLEMDTEDWENLSLETFQKVFKKSAVKRTKFSGLVRNIKFLKPSKPH